MKTKYLVFLFISINLLSNDAFAVTRTFTGASGGIWNLASNWDPSGIPGSADNVLIPAGKTVKIDNNAGTVNSLVVNGVLDMTDGGKLNVTTALYVDGTNSILGITNNDQMSVPVEGNVKGTDLNALNGTYGDFSVLPVQLIDLSAKQSDFAILVNWTVTDEINFNKFEMERSSNAISFERIGNIGGGNSFGTYDFEDRNPEQGLNYYRLKMIDLDGSYNYSKIISVNYTSEGKFSAYPNPSSTNEISLKGLGPNESVSLFGLDGKALLFDFNKVNNTLLLSSKLNQSQTIIIRTSAGKSTRVAIK